MVPITEQQWIAAEAVVDLTGLRHTRLGSCLWCFKSDHSKTGRYVDPLGLLESKTPLNYVFACLELGGRRMAAA